MRREHGSFHDFEGSDEPDPHEELVSQLREAPDPYMARPVQKLWKRRTQLKRFQHSADPIEDAKHFLRITGREAFLNHIETDRQLMRVFEAIRKAQVRPLRNDYGPQSDTGVIERMLYEEIPALETKVVTDISTLYRELHKDSDERIESVDERVPNRFDFLELETPAAIVPSVNVEKLQLANETEFFIDEELSEYLVMFLDMERKIDVYCNLIIDALSDIPPAITQRDAVRSFFRNEQQQLAEITGLTTTKQLEIAELFRKIREDIGTVKAQTVVAIQQEFKRSVSDELRLILQEMELRLDRLKERVYEAEQIRSSYRHTGPSLGEKGEAMKHATVFLRSFKPTGSLEHDTETFLKNSDKYSNLLTVIQQGRLSHFDALDKIRSELLAEMGWGYSFYDPSAPGLDQVDYQQTFANLPILYLNAINAIIRMSREKR